MNFELFLNALPAFREVEVDGRSAHEEILPVLAKERREAFKNDRAPKISAVAATIFSKEGEAHVLLIERQSYDGVHSGQVGFPGGKREEGDSDLQGTALREMEEEVGVPRSMPQFVRLLSEVYIPPSRFLVHPFVYVLEELPPLTQDPREVKDVIHLPLAHLLDERNVVEGKIKTSYGLPIKTPYFEFDHFKIWGATAMMLSEMKQMLLKIR